MKQRIIVLLTLIILSVSSGFLLRAQEVSLITSGEGSTKELAVRNALVSAVEQAYGVYVSGDTHILNDELIRDEMVQIRRGNIMNYRILNETKKKAGLYSAIVEATVSVENLLKFAKSKGAECELAGRAFAANLALKRLYLKNSAEAMEELYHVLGYIVPQMYDYRLTVGDPIVDRQDVYVPIAVDCKLNENYETFVELYKNMDAHINKSLESVGIKGNISDEYVSKIRLYRDSIMRLPERWILGFQLSDNTGSEVFPVSTKADYLWPLDKVAPYKINDRYNGEKYVTFRTPKSGTFHELPPHNFIIYEDLVIESHGPRIQKLDYKPMCSDQPRQKPLLRDYVEKAEDKFSKARAMGHTGVYGYKDFDERMIDWSDGFKQQSKSNGINHKWIDDPKKKPGVSVGTVYFFLCYDEKDINKITDIKINSIKEL